MAWSEHRAIVGEIFKSTNEKLPQTKQINEVTCEKSQILKIDK